MQYFWMRKKGHKNCLIGKNRLLFLLFFPFVFMCQFWGYYFFLSEGDDDENEEDEEDDGEDEDEPGLDYLQKENLEVGILHCFFLWGSIERMWKCCWCSWERKQAMIESPVLKLNILLGKTQSRHFQKTNWIPWQIFAVFLQVKCGQWMIWWNYFNINW